MINEEHPSRRHYISDLVPCSQGMIRRTNGVGPLERVVWIDSRVPILAEDNWRRLLYDRWDDWDWMEIATPTIGTTEPTLVGMEGTNMKLITKAERDANRFEDTHYYHVGEDSRIYFSSTSNNYAAWQETGVPILAEGNWRRFLVDRWNDWEFESVGETDAT